MCAFDFTVRSARRIQLFFSIALWQPNKVLFLVNKLCVWKTHIRLPVAT